MLIQNHVKYNILSKKSPYGVMVQWLRTWFFNGKVKSSNPHMWNVGYLGYLGDLIKKPRL
jgi:hypothetical protein